MKQYKILCILSEIIVEILKIFSTKSIFSRMLKDVSKNNWYDNKTM